MTALYIDVEQPPAVSTSFSQNGATHAKIPKNVDPGLFAGAVVRYPGAGGSSSAACQTSKDGDRC
jgi:hypothetical protein